MCSVCSCAAAVQAEMIAARAVRKQSLQMRDHMQLHQGLRWAENKRAAFLG